MITLTGEQKIIFYTRAKEIVASMSSGGICLALRVAAEENGFLNDAFAMSYRGMESYFPEVWKYKPIMIHNNHLQYWWPEHERNTRLNVLDKAIKEVREKI